MHLVPDIIRQLLQIVIINIIFSFGKGSGCFDCTVLSAEISNITLAFIQRLVSVEGSHNIHKIHDRHGGIPIFAHKDGVLRVVIENAYGFCFLTYQKFELCNRRKCRRDGIFFTFLCFGYQFQIDFWVWNVGGSKDEMWHGPLLCKHIDRFVVKRSPAVSAGHLVSLIYKNIVYFELGFAD